MLKKLTLVVALLLVATNLWAAKTLDVSAGRHNLSTTSTLGDNYYVPAAGAGAEDEVCIYCHTPHGGTLDGPLWNRDLPTSTFTHYTSQTVSGYLQGIVIRPVSTESLLCLSCHDGVAGVNAIINYSNRTGQLPNNNANISTFFKPGALIGDALDATGQNVQGSNTNISDDHPISFSYSSALSSKGTGLRTLAQAKTAGLRFFGPNDFVECSTCHDPHVDYLTGDTDYTPFLITPNTGSNLCLGCHIK